jgi:hypothetical protein
MKDHPKADWFINSCLILFLSPSRPPPGAVRRHAASKPRTLPMEIFMGAMVPFGATFVKAEDVSAMCYQCLYTRGVRGESDFHEGTAAYAQQRVKLLRYRCANRPDPSNLCFTAGIARKIPSGKMSNDKILSFVI